MNFRTDLADERTNIYKRTNNIENDIPGIETEDIKNDEDISTFRVKVINNEGEQAIGKPKGTYITIDIRNLQIAEETEISKAADVVSKEIKDLVENHIQAKEDILVVGLGNRYITPDSLGPKVTNEIFVTRHLLKYAKEAIDPNTRPITAISPGVLGITGIETLEVLKGIVENIKPRLIIAIDSLASKSIGRISSTIQISDTGIIPGAGIGNNRNEISIQTLGIPVIAIGVPMVVEAATIAADSIDLLIKKMQNEGKSNEYLNNLVTENKYEIIKEALLTDDFNLIVTPKEIDELVENMSQIVSKAINLAI